MVETTEFEEGEACYYNENDDGNTRTDLDIAFSHIDKRIQNVLGHFQKEFEGGVSAENLGSKFGGYGSFLPTYERPPSIQSHPKTPQRNYSVPRSPDNLPMEGATQSCTASSNVLPSIRLGTASGSAQSLHASRVPSVYVSVKQDSCLSSARVAETFPLNHVTLNKSVNPTDERRLKVRIKVGPGNTLRKNAEIYSGLGLDYSASSSLGTSSEESEGMPPEYRKTADESPTSILQIMTSFPVCEGFLISPLHDSLLCLITKERLYSKPVPALNGSQELSALSVNESASKVGDGEVLKEKKTRLMGKSEKMVESKHGDGMNVENDITVLSNRKIEIETPEGKEFLSNNLKLTPISNSIFDAGDSARGVAWVNAISMEPNKDGSIGKLSSSDLAKEESLESVSGQESGKNEKLNANSSSLENFCERRVPYHYKDVSVGPSDDGSCKSNKTSPLKADSDVSKRKEILNIEAVNPSKHKLGQKATFQEQDDIEMPNRGEKASLKGKYKSKGFQSNGKPVADLAVESSKVGPCAAPKDKKGTSCGVYPYKSKMHKSQMDNGMVGDNYKDLLGGTYLKQTDKRLDQVQRASCNRSKDFNADYVEKELNASFDKSKKRSSHKKVDKQSMNEVSLKAAPNAGPPLTENRSTSEMVPAAVAPVVIEENWVGCDSCQKWRLLPFGTKPEQLPEKWVCSMLNWLPGMNRCDVSEDETTTALNALYQLPVPENQNNLPNHANGTASGITLSDGRHLDQNHQNLSSHAMPNREKKKHKAKEIPNADSSSGLIKISKSRRNHHLESVKSRSLNDVNQPLSESSLMRKQLSKPCDLAVEKHAQRQKERHMNGGDAKQTKTKSKREADQYGYVASKKIKTEGVYCTDKYQNSGHGGDFGKVSLSSSAGMPSKSTGKDVQKHSGDCYYKDAKSAAKDRLLVSMKKQDTAQVSSDGGSSDLKTCDKRNISVKKRKLKDWQDSQDHVDTFKTTVHHLPDGRVFTKEESIEGEFRNVKKSGVSKTEGKESSTSKGDDRSSKKGRVTRIILSASGDHPIGGMKDLRSIEKDQQLGKHRGKVASPRTLDGIDLLKRDLGSRQVSMAATSSSSKVSGSCKSRANFQKVKGSPVESVSSSPLRSSNPDKLTPARGEILGKDDATNGGLSVMGNPERCLVGEGNGENNWSGTVKKENVSSVLHPKSLEYPTLDYRDGDANHKFGGKAKPCSEFGISHSVNGDADILEQHGRCSNDPHAVEHCYNEDRVNKNHFCGNVLFPQKSHKGSSLWSKDKGRSSRSDFDRDKMVSDPPSEQEDLHLNKSLRYESEIDPYPFAQCHEIINNVEHNFPDKCTIKSSKGDNNHFSKKVSLRKWSSESRKEKQSKSGELGGSDVKLGAPCSTNRNVTPPEKLIQGFECEKFSSQVLTNKNDPIQIHSGGEKPQLIMHREGKKETLAKGVHPLPGSQKEGIFNVLPVAGDADVSKALKQPGNAGDQNGAGHMFEHLTLSQHGVWDFNASSTIRDESSNQTASNALKEAKDLRDYADYLKSSGFVFESNEAYFQAALKFLHGASLLETCNSDNGKHGELNQMQMYSTTAKLCEFCAHEYESRQEMAAAALAYKCMEVAYMKVVYYKHFITSRDRHELHATLQMVPQGESPSSSASDVDNLNNQATLDKSALSKGSGSHVAGHHVIVARNRPNFIRLLDFTQDVSLAMDASRKSQIAFAAANVILKDSQNGEGITSVKRVIDFSFQDVDGLVRLVRLAMEAISRSGFCGSRD